MGTQVVVALTFYPWWDLPPPSSSEEEEWKRETWGSSAASVWIERDRMTWVARLYTQAALIGNDVTPQVLAAATDVAAPRVCD